MDFKDYWNNSHLEHLNDEFKPDNWLEEHKNDILFTSKPILDLGCGLGDNALYLTKLNKEVIALDYSDVALNRVKELIPSIKAVKHDISEKLPFDDNSFDIIVADLSLHYFDNETTIKIMKEIKRVLTKEGHLYARVNSVKDVNYGANEGTLLEHNYYYSCGYNKRFFNQLDAIRYFSLIGDIKVEETIITKYSKPKVAYKIVAQKL